MIRCHNLPVAYITVVITSWILAGAVGAGVGGAIHLVQIVDVYVLYTVEVTIPVETLLRPPIVMVFVSGHTVSYSVVLVQSAMANEESSKRLHNSGHHFLSLWGRRWWSNTLGANC